MLQKKNQGIIYIGTSSFKFYSSVSDTLTFTYPADSVKELEIVDETLFLKELKNFFADKKLLPANIIMVVSTDLLYEKEISDEVPAPAPDKTNPDAAQLETLAVHPPTTQINNEERLRKIRLFLDAVPFEDVIDKTYRVEKGVKVIATNKHFVSAIKEECTKHNLIIVGVVPVTMLGKDIPMPAGFNEEVAKKAYAKFEAIKAENMQEETNSITSTGELPNTHGIQMTTKVTSKREFALIGVFVGLMAILGTVTYTTFFSTPPKTKVASIEERIEPTALPSPTIEISATPASTSASFNRSALRIQVNGGTSLQADLLSEQLQKSGYTNVVTNPSNTAATGRAVVVFSGLLSSAVKEDFLAEVRKSVLNVSVQESSLADSDVVINL